MEIKRRLQLGDREESGKEWSTGVFDFPTTGPADLYALGVPRDTPIQKNSETPAATVKPHLDAIVQARDHFLKEYRAVVWSQRDRSGARDFESLCLLWHHGELVRQDRYFAPDKPLAELTTQSLVAYVNTAQPVDRQLLTKEREYTWRSAWARHADKPQVQVIRHQSFPLMSTDDWPEAMQWPTVNFAPDFELLDNNEETPAGCIGLRLGGIGTSRTDYYVDPHQDYVCIKQVEWIKPYREWQKGSERMLSDLQRIDGRVVARTRTVHFYKNPLLKTVASTVTTTIVLTPTKEFPEKIFDPEELTTGAVVEGF